MLWKKLENYFLATWVEGGVLFADGSEKNRRQEMQTSVVIETPRAKENAEISRAILSTLESSAPSFSQALGSLRAHL